MKDLAFGAVAQNGFHDAQERLLQLLLDVVLRIGRNAVLLHVRHRLGAITGARLASGCSHHHVGNAISHLRGRGRITLLHLLDQHDVGLDGCVFRRRFAVGLGDDQFFKGHLVLQKIRDHLLDVLDGRLGIALPKQEVEYGILRLGDEETVVPPYRFKSFGIDEFGRLGVFPM